jgi:hypothetical protein
MLTTGANTPTKRISEPIIPSNCLVLMSSPLMVSSICIGNFYEVKLYRDKWMIRGISKKIIFCSFLIRIKLRILTIYDSQLSTNH